MSVKFVAKTHYFFSIGKDGKLKEWDADKFERIITLDGHLSEIWSMAVSSDGKFVVLRDLMINRLEFGSVRTNRWF